MNRDYNEKYDRSSGREEGQYGASSGTQNRQASERSERNPRGDESRDEQGRWGRDSRGQGRHSSSGLIPTSEGTFSGNQGFGRQGQSFGPSYEGGYGSWSTERQSSNYQGGTHRGKGPKGYKRSDERIIEDINDELTDHDGIDASDIQVTCEDGEVTLEGTVTSRQAKRMAEDCAEDCAGVKNVQNNIKVKKESESETSSSSIDRSGNFSKKNR